MLISLLNKLRRRFAFLLGSERFEYEMGEELRFHLEKQIEDNIKAGMTPEEARYATLRTFGGVEQIKERCRDTHRFRFIEDFRQDVCYGFRMLLRNPGFSAVSVFSLALGIGANTAVFGLIDTLIFRPFPVRDPSDLAVFTSAFSYPEYLDYRDRNEVFTGVMAYRRLGFKPPRALSSSCPSSCGWAQRSASTPCIWASSSSPTSSSGI